jgi:hypothetical protein
MSMTALALNAFLAVLLIVALGFGWRLERRLKALRDSHEGFAKAVADLDQAAARAEQGLADLRAATAEASDQLADRITRAQALAAQLDDRLNRPVPPPKPSPAAPSPPPAAEPSNADRRRLRAEDFEQMLDREARAAPLAAQPISRAPPPRETPRSRARVDDDLFDGPEDTPRPGSSFRGRR